MYRQGSRIINLLNKNNANMINKIERCFYKAQSNGKSNKLKNSLQQGKFINKIMDRDGPKRPWYPARVPRNESMDLMKERLTNPHVTRRVIVLNKLFMKHITDLMAMGDIATQVLGRGIEISRVNLTNDFKVVRVYWFSSCTDLLDETSKILEKISYQLRHELTQLRIIGVVPLIQFVVDVQSTKTIELEKKFLEADYGDDYVPKITLAPKRQLTLFTQLPQEVKDKIRKMNDEKSIDDDDEYEDDEIYDIDLPAMRQDVLGFDHSIIMSTIKQSLNKARGKPFNQSEVGHHLYTPETIEIEFDKKYANLLPSQEEDEAFLQFLEKRKLDELRRHKQNRKQLENVDEYEECYVNENPIDDGIDYDEFDDIKTHELS